MSGIIAGNGKSEQQLYEILRTIPDEDILCFLSTESTDKECSGLPVLSYEKGILLYRSGKVDHFYVTPGEKLKADATAYSFLRLGVSENDIWYVSQNYDITPFFERRELSYLEYQVADNCNMNCSSCSHYSNLIKGNVLSDLESTRNGFLSLKKYVDNICLIRVLGGEPLINPELDKYIAMNREIFPDSRIEIVTNGILVNKMPDALIRSIKENRIVMNISFYPAMKDRMADVTAHLDSLNIPYFVSPMISEFSKVTDPSGSQNAADSFKKCTWRYCTMLRDDRLGLCAFSFLTKYFNEYYTEYRLPESGSFSLNEADLTTEKIMRRLNVPIEFCSYCKQPGDPCKWKHGPAGFGSPEDIIIDSI
ncbi:MAG: hypothetical protein K6C99_03585 [Lachnospiraceae bacterium]|nr:hypothetical protein [Lachnospiraceae bacterium]